jgi:hypothetical protein
MNGTSVMTLYNKDIGNPRAIAVHPEKRCGS